MEEKKICPILTIAKCLQECGLANCVESGCAWFDTCQEKCSILSLNDKIHEGVGTLC